MWPALTSTWVAFPYKYPLTSYYLMATYKLLCQRPERGFIKFALQYIITELSQGRLITRVNHQQASSTMNTTRVLRRTT